MIFGSPRRAPALREHRKPERREARDRELERRELEQARARLLLPRRREVHDAPAHERHAERQVNLRQGWLKMVL